MELSLSVLLEKGVGPHTISVILGINYDEAKEAVLMYRKAAAIRALKNECSATIASMAQCDDVTAKAIYDAISARIFLVIPQRRKKTRPVET